jgi:hypothetical protein
MSALSSGTPAIAPVSMAPVRHVVLVPEYYAWYAATSW